VTLDEFAKEIQSAANNFPLWWKDQHDADPDAFPLAFDANNAGMWWEQFRWFFEERTE